MHSKPRRKRRTGQLLAVLSAAVIAASAVVILPLSAFAADIANGITSVTLNTSGAIKEKKAVSFSGSWAVPDASAPGDTFTLQLPPELSWQGTTTFPLTNGSGDTVATAAVSPTGLVTFTLTDFVATHPNSVSGTFTFTTTFTGKQTDAGPASFEFHVSDTVINVPYTAAGPSSPNTGDKKPADWTNPFKNMYFTTPDQATTTSQLAANAGPGENNELVMIDRPADGLSLNCSSVITTTGMTLSSGGKVLDPVDYHPTVECSTSELRVTWTGLPANMNALTTVISNVTDSNLDSYTNNGWISINGVDHQVGYTLESLSASGNGNGNGTDENTGPVDPDENTNPLEPDENTNPVDPDENTNPLDPDENTNPLEPDENTNPLDLREAPALVGSESGTQAEVPTESTGLGLAADTGGHLTATGPAWQTLVFGGVTVVGLVLLTAVGIAKRRRQTSSPD